MNVAIPSTFALTKAELMTRHAEDRVGYAVVLRDAGPPRWVGGGRMVDAALYVRRDRGRPASDFGPMALMRIVPKDEWTRASSPSEARYFKRYPPSCWTGALLDRNPYPGIFLEMEEP